MSSITIIKPRLDVTFKEGPIPKDIGPISPIRMHWANFVEKIKTKHKNDGNIEIKVIEKPLWQFTKEELFAHATSSNIIYIPHRQKYEIAIDNALYYMQTVFPEFFTIDKNGWGAHMSYIPLLLDNVIPNEQLWEKLQSRIRLNVSKFDQPEQYLESLHLSDYWLFVCQIPHDQVIIQSSKISVADALRKTIELARLHDKKVLVKPHPVNPSAMFELYEISMKNKDVVWWVNDISIHTALKHCSVAFMVNSGVGFEAMLHEKPIVTFGNAEYNNVVNIYNDNETTLNKNIVLYKKFMTAFFEKLIYTGEKDGKFYDNITHGFEMGRNQIYG